MFGFGYSSGPRSTRGGTHHLVAPCVLLAGAHSLWALTSLLWGLSSGLERFSKEPWFFLWMVHLETKTWVFSVLTAKGVSLLLGPLAWEIHV